MLESLPRRIQLPHGSAVRVAEDQDRQLLDAIEAHPILLNRPIVVTPKGTRLCRPSEAVLPLLPPMTGTFTKEDGEVVIDERGNRVR